MKRILIWSVVFIVLALLILPGLVGGGTRLVGSLLFGWIGFLKRVLPEISISWSGIGMVALCSALIIAGTHWLGGWIYGHNVPATDNPARWKWSWSISLYVGLWLLFLAAIGVTGFVHQTAWLIRSNKPMMVERRSSRTDLRQTAIEIAMAAQDENWDLAATRKAFFAENFYWRVKRKLAIEQLHVLFLPGKGGKLEAVVVFPRDLAQRERTGFLLVRPEGERSSEDYPLEKLPEILAKFGNSPTP